MTTTHQQQHESNNDEKMGDHHPSSSSSSSSAAVPSAPTTTISQCPYAVALSEDDASSSTATVTSGTPSSASLTQHYHHGEKVAVPSQIAAEISHCPAFHASNNNSNSNSSSSKLQCPFKEAKSPEEVQKTLAQIPKSHYSDNKQAFYQVMQHLHQVVFMEKTKKNTTTSTTSSNGNSDANSFVEKLPVVQNGNGKCPMQPYLPEKGGARTDFAQAFEDCSLAAIMGRLAADMDKENNRQQQRGQPSQEEEGHDSSDDEVEKDNGGAVGVQELNPVEMETEKPITDEQQQQQQQKVPKQRDSLAQALKQGTVVAHQAAEDVHFVRNFIRGQIDRELYQSLIMSLYHVYVALEDALDQEAPKHFDSCHFPNALRRVPSLREDIEFWHNTTDPSPRTIGPATQDYMDRIRYLQHHDPLLLLAHSYTRYLGDLSGGRVLARVARRALDLDKDGQGLAFYSFDNVKSYKQFKDHYRQALDELSLTSHQIQALVAEANVAFCLNMRIFQELDVMATIEGSRVMSLEEVMSYAHKSVDENNNSKEEDKCPFLVNKKQQQQQQQQPSAVSTAEKTLEHSSGKRCPWPFVFAQDPAQGLRDWQTWALLFVVIAVWLQLAY